MDTSWEGLGEWYDRMILDPNSIQNRVILPNLIRLADPKKGEQILDIGCGTGFFSKALSLSGAKVVGVDPAHDNIILAKRNCVDCEFILDNAQKLEKLSGRRFEKAILVSMLDNIKDVNSVFCQLKKILLPKATVVIVINHPAFRIPKFSEWQTHEKKGIILREISEYMSESSHSIDMHPSSKNKKFTTTYHRPIQYYFKILEKNGFLVKRVEEWISHKKSEVGPRALAEDSARKEFPMFMAIAAKKK